MSDGNPQKKGQMERRLASRDRAFCFRTAVKVCLPQLLGPALNIQMACVGVDTPVVLESLLCHPAQSHKV